MMEDSLGNLPYERGVEIPPNPEKRIFNEHDIMGDLDRDEKLEPIVLEGEDGEAIDKKG
jgi:hypothetical protein